MSIGSQLIHRCTIQTPRDPNADMYGAGKRVYTDESTNEPCRLVEKTQRVLDSVTGERAIITTYLLLLSPTCTIKPGDRVTDIVDETRTLITKADGVTAATFRVESVIKRRGRAVRHISCQLERNP